MTTLGQALAVIRSFDDQMPVPVFEITHALGLGPVFEHLTANVSGMIRRSNSDAGYAIVINSGHHRNRQRFTCAHELGHYIFHRDRLNGGVGDTLAYRADGSGAPNPMIGAAQETEANRFAANLLMPNRLIEKLAQEGVTDPAEVARRLQVSEDAIRIKMGSPPREPPKTLFG